MAYNKKFKLRVLEHLGKGHTQQETAKLFGIGVTTLKEWKKRQEAGMTLEAKIRIRKPKKIEPERLREYITAHPDAYISERERKLTARLAAGNSNQPVTNQYSGGLEWE